MDIVSKARDLAQRAHAGQVDKAGRPYIKHVARVAAAVSDDPVAEAVAWLHDVLEDCDECFHEAVFVIGSDVALAVMRLTRSMMVDDEQYYELIRLNKTARRVKLADIADNSSEERLALLDDRTAARLRRKYAKALQALTAEEAPDVGG